MPATKSSKKVGELQAAAAKALEAGKFFEAEQLASEAFGLLRSKKEYTAMAEMVPLLRDARDGRLQQALATKKITIVDVGIEETDVIEPGCYLIRPPQVGADGRRLRLRALEEQVPIAVLSSEPMTQLRLLPVVAICPGTTVRTKVDPPADLDDPDVEWFAYAMEEIGHWAIDSLDPDKDVEKRVEALIDRLTAIPEHLDLHNALATTCLEAAAKE